MRLWINETHFTEKAQACRELVRASSIASIHRIAANVNSRKSKPWLLCPKAQTIAVVSLLNVKPQHAHDQHTLGGEGDRFWVRFAYPTVVTAGERLIETAGRVEEDTHPN